MILNLEKLRRDYKANRKKEPKAAEKVLILIEYTKIKLKYESKLKISAKKIEVTSLTTSLELSPRTLRRYERLYNGDGIKDLINKDVSGRPPVDLSSEIQKLIEEYRRLYKWGSEVIQAHLRYDHQLLVTRFKIERYLTTSGLRDKYPCTTIKKQKAQKKKKHTKKVVVANPGDHTQMDVKYQNHLLENKTKCYVYNFVDHASNWSFKHPYSAINAQNTKDFMERLLEVSPFDINRLQTDNGVEFTYKYISGSPDEPKEHPLDIFCEHNNIIHKLIPPGEKELQGLVERSHRQDDQELFSRITPEHLKDFQKELEKHYKWRNSRRRFKKLGWLTPNEWLTQYIIKTFATVLHLQSLSSLNNILFFTKEDKKIKIKKAA